MENLQSSFRGPAWKCHSCDVQPVPLVLKPVVFPLCRLHTQKTEASLNWAFAQFMKLSLECLSHQAFGQYLGVFTLHMKPFLSHYSQQPVWVFLAKPGRS